MSESAEAVGAGSPVEEAAPERPFPRMAATASRAKARLIELSRYRVGALGVALVSGLVLIALAAPLIAGADPLEQALSQRLQPPSAAHWFGVDGLGRDVFARVVYGARPSIAIVFLSLAVTAPAGLAIGAAAGFAGGWIDVALMRVSDVFMGFPRLILALAAAATLGTGLMTLIFAIVATGWPPYARIARSQAVSLARADFVAAAETIGASPTRILFVHIAPHCLPAIIVRAALDAPAIVLIIAGLGFLGAGVPPPQPEWGAMVADGRATIFEHWWISTIPGLFILALSAGFSLIADALRDLIDPHAR